MTWKSIRIAVLLSSLVATTMVKTVWGLDAPGSFISFSRTATVLDVRATGADLDITLEWNGVDPSTLGGVLLTVRAAGGETVFQDTVVPLASGQSTEIAVNALAEVILQGLQYEVFLEGLDGVRHSDAMPVRIRLDCATRKGCDFEAIPGVDTDGAAWITPEFAEALDLASDEGGDDLWQAVANLAPRQQSNLFTYQLELEVQNDGFWQEGNCSCVFTARAATQGTLARGFGHLIGASADHANTNDSSTGWTRLDMELRCYQLLSHQTGTTLTLPGGQSFTVNRRAVTGCTEPCAPEIRQKINFSGWSWAVGDPGRYGVAETDLTYSVDQQPVWSDEVKAEKTIMMFPRDDEQLLATRRQPGASGLLDTNSTASVVYSTPSTTIYSTTKAEFDLLASGKMSCIDLRGRASVHARQWERGTPAEIELFGGEEDEDDGSSG